MKFSEYKGVCHHLPRKDFASHVRASLRGLADYVNRNHDTSQDIGLAASDIKAAALAEMAWDDLSRPYILIPDGSASLMRLVESSTKVADLGLPRPAILLRYQNGTALFRIRSNQIVMIAEFSVGDTPARKLFVRVINELTTINDLAADTVFTETFCLNALDMLFSIGMTKQGECLVPEILAKDRIPYKLAQPGKMDEAIDRAIRRGKVGWALKVPQTVYAPQTLG